MTEEPETATKIDHKNLSWTTCSDDQCWIHRSFKKNVKWYPKKKKILKKKPNISNKFYPTETPVTAVMMIKIGKSKIPALITQNTENMISISFANRIKKYLDNECIRIGAGLTQYVTIESKHGFLGFTGFKFKKNSKNFVVLGQQWEKNINAQINFKILKKQKKIPQTIHILVYKNAIANKLRATQKLPIKNVEQFDDMIKHNDNPMNNSFWHLFKQLISQFAQIHKKTDTAVATWEYHFQKLQRGLLFDEDNPDVIDISENENCNKKIIQNDAGPSQDKSNDRYKTHSLDEYVNNKMEGLQAIPKHLDIDKRKTLDVQIDTQNFFYETFNT